MKKGFLFGLWLRKSGFITRGFFATKSGRKFFFPKTFGGMRTFSASNRKKSLMKTVLLNSWNKKNAALRLQPGDGKRNENITL